MARFMAEGLAWDALSRDTLTEEIWMRAFARPPNTQELGQIRDYFETRSGHDPEDVWAEIIHVVFNMKEFIYLR